MRGLSGSLGISIMWALSWHAPSVVLWVVRGPLVIVWRQLALCIGPRFRQLDAHSS